MDQGTAAFNQLPSYLRPYNYQPNSYGYSSYQGLNNRSASVTPPLTSSPEDFDQPPPKRFAAGGALPTFYPPPHLFRPVDFEAPSANTNSLLRSRPTPQRDNELVLTPSNTSDEKDSDGSRPSSAGGTQSIIGIDANYSDNGITASLMEADLWKSFNRVGNEMIVTKPGRRIFPSLMVSLRGLDPKMNYSISMRIAPVDQYRYKFISRRWVAVGESEILQDESRQVFRHPNSPQSGSFWMKKPISFKSCKITHNPQSKYGNVLLHTMHKYVMVVTVTPVDSDKKGASISLKATEFIAVTAYQNTDLTQLKIDNNPFAKGFRDRDVSPYPPPGMISLPPLQQFTTPLSWEPGQHVPTYNPRLDIMTPSGSSTSPSPTFGRSPASLPVLPHPTLPHPTLPHSIPYPIPPPLVSNRIDATDYSCGYSADYSDED